MNIKLKFYNTLTRKKEEFIPKTKNPTMYSCGPTVYSYAHIGNLRAYIFMDSIRRVLKFNGYKIKGVMNITDVGHLTDDGDDGEDKMAKKAAEEKKTPWQIADEVTKIFMRDIGLLNIDTPEVVAKATNHIDDMLKFVVGLTQKGHAYETSDGIYFDVSTFNDYGKLSGQKGKLAEQISGARVNINSEKKNPQDFALWKKAPKNHIMQWPSPWGQGFPGWHIECSAIAKKFLGAAFDIHTGGVDHIPIHHENEIAQSEALDGCNAGANFWMHNEFMQVNGGKMSKSLGNTYTLTDLADKGISPLAFRYFCLNTHYRKALNFTFDGVNGAATAYKRLLNLLAEHKDTNKACDLTKYKEEFITAINDDINIPLAIGVLWTMVKESPLSKDVFDLAVEFDKVLGLDLEKAEKEKIADIEIPENIKNLLSKRTEARKNKDFKASDILRNELAKLGWAVKDTANGQEITKI
ncbi:MAG: cysteine--tRNA ligase [Firmicutes bacterium]|nr:cysteine--tRNA ligase [Bacillota bacterium]